MDATLTLYRGVGWGHPGLVDAIRGEAHPFPWRGFSGPPHADAWLHNAEGDTTSIYTSWTADPATAKVYATLRRLGGRGVVLTQTFPLWRVVPSPDVFGEGEFLVVGFVTNATVEWAF